MRRRDAAEGRQFGEKFAETSFWVLKACKPLKSHKTAKAFFGKAWRKTA
jgi:hypothetical protein